MLTDVLSNLIITKVNYITTLYSQKNARQKRNDRSNWAIVMKYEGETIYKSNGKSTVSDSECIAILPKGSSYEWCCTREGHFFLLEFESKSTFSRPLFLPVKSKEKILKMLRDLNYNQNLKKTTRHMELIRDTYSLLLALLQDSSTRYVSKGTRESISSVAEYVCAHCTENITNDMLAEKAGFSTAYFRKLFTDIMGISPIAYLHRVRIERAKELLNSDYGTLTDLAISLGYLNLYDFSRDFKKHVGVPPSKYL